LRGGAGSLLRNIKDTSSKVMQTVQQSMARTELDASYLTSRILVMPYPVDGIESAYRANHVEDVRAFLMARHPPPTKIQFYNLSRGRPNVTRLIGRHIDCSFAYASSEANAPLLSAIYQICQDIYRYLNADVHHVVVLYCNVSNFHPYFAFMAIPSLAAACMAQWAIDRSLSLSPFFSLYPTFFLCKSSTR
jgi:cyclin G-associated kinase